jgi:hypothetical protein
LSPIEERFSLDDIVSELRQKSNVELFNLKAFDNVCANGLVDCRGLASTNIKLFIDAILSDRSSRRDRVLLSNHQHHRRRESIH